MKKGMKKNQRRSQLWLKPLSEDEVNKEIDDEMALEEPYLGVCDECGKPLDGRGKCHDCLNNQFLDLEYEAYSESSREEL